MHFSQLNSNLKIKVLILFDKGIKDISIFIIFLKIIINNYTKILCLIVIYSLKNVLYLLLMDT